MRDSKIIHVNWQSISYHFVHKNHSNHTVKADKNLPKIQHCFQFPPDRNNADQWGRIVHINGFLKKDKNTHFVTLKTSMLPRHSHQRDHRYGTPAESQGGFLILMVTPRILIFSYPVNTYSKNVRKLFYRNIRQILNRKSYKSQQETAGKARGLETSQSRGRLLRCLHDAT